MARVKADYLTCTKDPIKTIANISLYQQSTNLELLYTCTYHDKYHQYYNCVSVIHPVEEVIIPA